MHTRVIRATDLAEALAKVRLLYGDDALIVETRSVMVRAENALSPQRRIEVVVADPEGTEVHRVRQFNEPALAEPAGGRALERLHAITDRIERMSAQVRHLAVDHGAYPLTEALREAGCRESTIRRLAARFAEESQGGPRTESAARLELAGAIPTLQHRGWKQLRGEHWWMGRAGSGKTSLVLHVAAHVKAAGGKVGIIGLGPQNDGDVVRLQSAARALDVDAAVAAQPRELVALRRHMSGHDALLIDTPCFVSRPWRGEIPESARRHLIVPLLEDPELLRAQVELPRLIDVDDVVLSQRDLCPWPGRILDLMGEIARPLLFIAGRVEGALELEFADARRLVDALVKQDEQGARRLELACAEAVA